MSDKRNRTDESLRDRYDPANKTLHDLQKTLGRLEQEPDKPINKLRAHFQRKRQRMLGGFGNAGKMFLTGFMHGSMIGVAIGLVSGVVVAVQTRRMSFFFLVTLSSSLSFGCIMGIGTLIRSKPLPKKLCGPYPTGKEWTITNDI